MSQALRGQITHQERRNNDLFSSNATLRKLNSELTAQLDELKSKNEELTTNQAALVEKNAELISQMDGVRDELASEKAMSAGLKFELETAALKVQTIVVDGVLSMRAKLMGEFKRGEHSNWDLDEEIWTWDKRAAVLAGGEALEDEPTPVVEGSEQAKGVDPGNAEPDVGATKVHSSLERWLRILRT